MTCREVLDFLMRYDAGELPADQQRAFDCHLAACPPCVAYLKTYRQTVRLAHDACADADQELKIPPDLVRAILDARRKS